MNTENFVYVVGFLFAVSEALAYIPAIKANSVFQAITGVLKWLHGKVK